MQRLDIGDHIYIQKHSPILYTHHGIVVGGYSPNTIRIAHPVKSENGEAKFAVTDLNGFIGNLGYCIGIDVTDPNFYDTISMIKQTLRTNPYVLLQKKTYRQALPSYQIVRNAMAYVHSNASYCLISNNCEMFADYCSTGVKPNASRQVLNIMQKILNGNEITHNINMALFDFLYTNLIG
jgi:hypothetical protein